VLTVRHGDVHLARASDPVSPQRLGRSMPWGLAGLPHGMVNLLKIVPRRLALEEMCVCVRGENTGVQESTKPSIVLSLLYRRIIFRIRFCCEIYFIHWSAAAKCRNA
jgi:hypothetical protein